MVLSPPPRLRAYQINASLMLNFINQRIVLAHDDTMLIIRTIQEPQQITTCSSHGIRQKR